jgi:hypothetical protein
VRTTVGLGGVVGVLVVMVVVGMGVV